MCVAALGIIVRAGWGKRLGLDSIFMAIILAAAAALVVLLHTLINGGRDEIITFIVWSIGFFGTLAITVSIPVSIILHYLYALPGGRPRALLRAALARSPGLGKYFESIFQAPGGEQKKGAAPLEART